jgi:hypothetical protein
MLTARMRHNDGRRLDHATLEQLRICEVQQSQQGTHSDAIAKTLGMARSTVFGWMAGYRGGGPCGAAPANCLVSQSRSACSCGDTASAWLTTPAPLVVASKRDSELVACTRNVPSSSRDCDLQPAVFSLLETALAQSGASTTARGCS